MVKIAPRFGSPGRENIVKTHEQPNQLSKKPVSQHTSIPVRRKGIKAISHKVNKLKSIKDKEGRKSRVNKLTSHKDEKALRQQGSKLISPKDKKAITGRPTQWSKQSKAQVRWYLPDKLIREINHYLIDNNINKQDFFTNIVSKGFNRLKSSK